MFDLAHATPFAGAAIGSRQMPVNVTPDDKTCTWGANMAGVAIA